MKKNNTSEAWSTVYDHETGESVKSTKVGDIRKNYYVSANWKGAMDDEHVGEFFSLEDAIVYAKALRATIKEQYMIWVSDMKTWEVIEEF